MTLRSFGRALTLAALVSGLSSTMAESVTSDRGAAPTREQLLGAWRLVRIEYQGSHGAEPDPYYAADSVGVLIYDSTGWMSVQIASAARSPVSVPADRRTTRLTPSAALARARAFDTYYAYFGRWDYDPTRGVLTHHISASLIPEEQDMSYFQEVRLVEGRLVMTNRGTAREAPWTRRKIWEPAAATTAR